MPESVALVAPASLVAELAAELAADLAELVMLASSELIDERSAPVAVDSSDDKLDMALAASLVIELIPDEAAELAEERAEDSELVREAAAELSVLRALPSAEVAELATAGTVVVVVLWA